MYVDRITLLEKPAPRQESELSPPASVLPRYSALEWLAIATLARANPGRDEELLHSLRTLYGQCENDPDRARLDGLIGMAALIGAVGPDAFTRRIGKFLSVGFSQEHLQLLSNSLAQQNHDALDRSL